MTALTPHQRLQRLDKLAWLLDANFRVPGTQFRFGLDGLIGLIPGVGDVIGAVFSAYIMVQSARSGASAALLLRMVGNILIEALVGLVPVLGDLFDIAFRANLRNVALLRAHLQAPQPVQRQSNGLLWAILAIALGICVGIAWLAVLLLQWLFSLGGA